MELLQEKKKIPCLLICRSGRRRDVHDNKKVFLFMPFLRGHLSPQKGGAWLHMNNSQGACRVGRRPPKKSALFEIEKKKVSSYMCTLAWHVFFPGRLSSATTRKVPSPNPFLLAAKARLQGRKRGGGGGKWSSAHRKTLSFSSPPPSLRGFERGHHRCLHLLMMMLTIPFLQNAHFFYLCRIILSSKSAKVLCKVEMK